MNRRLAIAGLLLMLTVFLSGCWDQLQIEERGLVLGLAIDPAPPESETHEIKSTHLSENLPKRMLKVTAQIAVPGRVPLGPGSGSEGGSKNQNPVWVVSVVGRTLDDCMNNLQQKIADPRYLVHLRVIVISKEIAREGFDELNDYFRRNPEIRRTTWLLVAEGPAIEFMTVAPPLQRVPTLYLLAMLEKAVDSGKFPQDYLGSFWSAESKWGQDGFLPYVSVRSNENILINGLAYFKDGRMAGTTLPLDIGAFMAVQGMEPGGYSVLFKVPGLGHVMVQTTERYANKITSVSGGKPSVTCELRLEAVVEEQYGSDQSVNSTSRLKEISAALDRVAHRDIMALIRKTQQESSDIFGIGELFRSRHPAYWRANVHSPEDWTRIYHKLPIKLDVHYSIRRVGLKAK